MRKNKGLFQALLSILIIVTLSTTIFNTTAFAGNAEEDYMPGWQSAGYAYADQIYFDPLDTRALNDIDYNKFNALADESYYWNLNGRDPEKCRKEYEEIANAIVSKVNPNWSEFRKLAYLHDYICETTDYDYYGSDMIKQSAYGCLVLHNCVCDGYARAFYDLANRVGVTTYYVLSNQLNHAWNVAKVDGRYYFIDCTWDGTYTTGHEYFLKSESYMRAHSHYATDICIPAYATVGFSTDVSIYNKYNNTTYDEAPFTMVTGPLCFVDDSDRYYDVDSYGENLYLYDKKSIVKEIPITYNTETSSSVTYFFLRGNKVILCRNMHDVFSGTVEGDTLELKLLYQPEKTDTWYTTYALSDFSVSGNYLYFSKSIFNFNTGQYSDTSSDKIDISSILAGTSDPFDLSKRGYVINITDTSGSPAVIDGLNLQWNNVNGKSYWYENGVKQGTYDDAHGILGDGTIRGREIYDPATGGWYWLDSCYFGAKAVNKEVWMPYVYQNENPDDDDQLMNLANICDGGWDGMGRVCYEAMKNKTGKWVRYNEEGKMLKGWVTIEGALAQLYPKQTGNVYYYDSITGLMAKGNVTIDGVSYYFDEITGVLKN